MVIIVYILLVNIRTEASGSEQCSLYFEVIRILNPLEHFLYGEICKTRKLFDPLTYLSFHDVVYHSDLER